MILSLYYICGTKYAISLTVQIKIICLSVADPEFGQGARNFSQDFANIANQSWVSKVRASIDWGSGPALGPWKLLHF